MNAAIGPLPVCLLMMVATSFLDSFSPFPSALAVPFSAWIGAFGVDQLRGRAHDAAAPLDTSPVCTYQGAFRK